MTQLCCNMNSNDNDINNNNINNDSNNNSSKHIQDVNDSWDPPAAASNDNNNNNNNNAATLRMVHGKDDALFGCIEREHNTPHPRPFGAVLDAGTGLHSLRWIATLPAKGMTSFTAITADETMRRNVQREADALGIRHLGQILMGNWFAESATSDNDKSTSSNSIISSSSSSRITKSDFDHILNGQLFDTILVDYLIGAMDGFSPYQQDLMLPKLAQYLKPNTGRLYIVGLEPIPDSVPTSSTSNPDANIVCRVRQVRDACILLAGHRCYREYPATWIERQLLLPIPTTTTIRSNHTKTPSMPPPQHYWRHVCTRRFPILYRHATIVRQINVARSKFPYFPSTSNPSLVDAMRRLLDDLELESLQATQRSPTGKIQLGFDYVIVAERRES